MLLEELARQVLAESHAVIFSHEEAAARGDVDAVHDMRVATRRLRVALGNFAVCCDRDARREMNARIQQLADALGGVRDLDVFALTLREQMPERPPEDRPHISALVKRLRDRRRRRLRSLRAFFGGAEYAIFKRDFLAVLGAAPEAAVVDHPPELITAHGQSL